ncbi:MAG: CDP-glycerol glycerophosphotransferase family protein [Treponema sp.]|nr:CDP-glycerol glycerophosphotransferase family protein [Treponema sp.]
MTYFFLYIDPGTGSMLFSLFITLAATATLAARALYLKLKFAFSLGKAEKAENQNIPIVIFSDHKRYWNVFKPVCDEFERRGVPLVYYTESPDDPALSEKFSFVKTEFIGEGNKPYAKLNMLHASVLVSTTPNLDVYQWKRSKYVKWYVHVPHSADELAGYRMFALDYYDAVLVTGKNQLDFIREIESLRPKIKKKEIVLAGYPVFDTMKNRLSLLSEREVGSEKKTVLLAPSWGKSGILSLYGEKLLSALSKTDFNIVIRPHPQTVVSEQDILRPLEEKFSSVEWNYDNDNFAVLNKADILITDFSGIIFDFALVFDKPVIYTDPTGFDTLPYDADWLSEPRWAFKVLPKIGVKLDEGNFSRIGSIVEAALGSQKLQEGRNSIRAEAWHNQGNAAKSIADYIIETQKKIEEREKAAHD